MTFLSALKDEIATLEKALAEDKRYIRLRHLERALELYRDAESEASTVSSGAIISSTPAARTSVRQTSSERERALVLARTYIDRMGRIVPTREILDHLVAQDVDLGGSSPLNNLSALISTSGFFQSHGRSGWTIKTNIDGSNLTVEDYKEVSREVIECLEAKAITEIQEAIQRGISIPSDIDRQILAKSRDKNNGPLTEAEKRELRKVFSEEIEFVA